MLRLELLRPGDVVLASFDDPLSRALVEASSQGSPARIYSHAAIVIHYYQWFEATAVGNGVTHHGHDKIEVSDGEGRRLHDLAAYQNFAVFRHPGLLAGTSADYLTLGLQVFEAAHEFMGFQYPARPGFSERLPWLRQHDRAKRIVEYVLRRQEKDGQEVINPGALCAELVVYVYQNLAGALNRDVPLLRDGPYGPFEVSPNDLADPAISNLVELPEAVCLERTDLPNHSHAASAVYESKDWEELGQDNLTLLVDLKTEARALDLQRQSARDAQARTAGVPIQADKDGPSLDDKADRERQ